MRGVLKKSSQFIFVFALTVSWVFFGWSVGLSFAQEATSTPPEQIAITTPEIISESAIEITMTATTTDENSGEEIVENGPQQIVDNPPPQPLLSMRRFERKIMIDKKAAHACEAETFRVDISGRTSAQARVMFLRDTDTPYEMELGGLPDGIDITFSKNGAYRYVQDAGDRYLTLLIHTEAGAQKGNFSIPIVYTQKGVKDSSVVCQINLINQ